MLSMVSEAYTFTPTLSFTLLHGLSHWKSLILQTRKMRLVENTNIITFKHVQWSENLQNKARTLQRTSHILYLDLALATFLLLFFKIDVAIAPRGATDQDVSHVLPPARE
jgi:hypothetical protein